MERRTVRFTSFDEALRDGEALMAGGYDRAGNWGLAQVSDHLALVIGMSVDGFPSRAPWPVRFLARWLVLPRIFRHQVFRRRVAAPKYVVPPDTSDDRAALQRLRTAIDHFRGHTGEMAPSPFFGPLTTDEWREVHLWHCEHHLSFLLPRSGASAETGAQKA
jgi:hypothetical protein